MSFLYKRKELPFEVFEVKLLGAGKEQLLQISQKLALALNIEEMRACKQYFSKKGRNPTDIELQTIGQTWSEHCYHKTFKGEILVGKRKVRLFKDFISRVTKELSPPWCISVFEDNAGIVDFGDGYAIAAKVETHNHPSAIEPFGGAATGVGGVIRDILGVWAKPIANIDVLGFGPLDYKYKALPAGVKHPKYIFRGVVAGIGSYGNNMGIPTVSGGIYFDESYVGNPVVYCGCVGLLPIGEYVKETKPGDIAVLAGGRTGRDGIHGVTFASAELTEESEEISRPAVQIADPIEEEKLRRAILQIRDEGLASGITDLGGGGLSCAAGEVANRSNCSIQIELEKAPLKYPNMLPWEIWISESQERMFLTVPGKNIQRVLEIFDDEDVEAAAVGRFTQGNTVKVVYHGHEVLNLDIDFLFGPPMVRRTIKRKGPKLTEPRLSQTSNLTEVLLKLLAAPNIASRESVVRTYDHEVQGNTILKPLHGKHGGPNDAAILKPLQDSWRGVVISCGMNPSYGRIDPYWMATSSVEEAIRNNVAVGGRRIALLDNFTWGNPEKMEQLSALVEACKACYESARAFGTPFISGKDSLYNESPLGPVTPTLLVTAIGIIPDIRRAISVDIKEPSDAIYIVGRTYPELGGSEYYRLFGEVGRSVPKLHAAKAKKVLSSITKAIDAGYVRACHDLSEGGLAVAAAEMVLSSDYGAELDLRKVPASMNGMVRDDFILFSESNSRFLVEVARGKEKKFEKLVKSDFALIGEVSETDGFFVRGLKGRKIIDTSSRKLREAWRGGLDHKS
ncbi:MAG TPA: phosphoribosylformylglycinamidine synthase subunit PurL [Hadesarchaea archaeon]|nr:phosphoribosylformylglycinamidine synthase subunit PurL [Hadesarchaea archaeon]